MTGSKYGQNSKAQREMRALERLTDREPLPRMVPPRGAPHLMRVHTSTFNIRVERNMVWKFRRACYAKGITGGEAVRNLMQQEIDEYEARQDARKDL